MERFANLEGAFGARAERFLEENGQDQNVDERSARSKIKGNGGIERRKELRIGKVAADEHGSDPAQSADTCEQTKIFSLRFGSFA